MNRRFHASGWVVGAGLALAGQAAAQGGLIDPNEAKIGTLVSFQTDAGDITVGLFDTTTPQTVDNFLNYVNDGDFDGGFFHRLVDNFVIQGGLAVLDGSTVVNVPTDPPVQNEPFVTNTLGTIAMAKVGGDPNSATSQFFFSLDDNSSNLDNQNGGFTAFGVIVEGLDNFLTQVATLDIGDATAQLGSAYSDLPVEDFDAGLTVGNLVSYTIDVVGTLGDLNDDDTLDGSDLDLLAANLGTGSTFGEGDIDFDGDVDVDDLTAWLNLLDTVPGDANLDQVVDTSDLAILAASFGTSGTGYTQADFNIDGTVNTSDLAILAASFGFGDAVPSASGAAIPEPASLALLGSAGLAALIRRRAAACPR
ncbi:MAG: peptidylprolyl isomerase [Planctomycetota bacterium]